MNKRAIVYLGLASILLAGSFIYFRSLEPTAATTVSASQAESAASAEPAQFLPQITIAQGSLKTAPLRLKTQVGGIARFLIATDTADELHVHGVDKVFDLQAGGVNEIEFEVTQTGAFEAELHGSGLTVGLIEVYPSKSH